MARYIDAEKIEKTLWDSLKGYRHTKEICAVKNCILEIEEAPTAEVEEVKHGEWKLCFEDFRKQIDGDECSACGFQHYGSGISHYKYCPNCGAKMDGERSETK